MKPDESWIRWNHTKNKVIDPPGTTRRIVMINGRCRVSTELKTRGGKTMKQVCGTQGMKVLSLAKLIRWTLTFWLDKCEVLWGSSSYLVALLMRPFNLQDSLTREECFNYVDERYRALQDCLCKLTAITSCRSVSSSSLYSYGSQLYGYSSRYTWRYWTVNQQRYNSPQRNPKRWIFEIQTLKSKKSWNQISFLFQDVKSWCTLIHSITTWVNSVNMRKYLCFVYICVNSII